MKLPKFKKWQVILAAIILLLIILNPAREQFIEYSGMDGGYTHYITRKANFLIFSIYQDHDSKYLGILMNFIPLN